MDRRDLIRKIAVGSATVIVMPSLLTSCEKKDDPPAGGGNPPPGGSNKITIDLTDTNYTALNTTGNSVVVSSVIIANTGGGNFVALSAVCTHQGCTVGYSAASNNFPCPCHGSVFSSTGAVVNGPASTALKSYTVSKAGNVLTINLT
jgi:cytochrome b6-f complex iron-sulfur subunit